MLAEQKVFCSALKMAECLVQKLAEQKVLRLELKMVVCLVQRLAV